MCLQYAGRGARVIGQSNEATMVINKDAHYTHDYGTVNKRLIKLSNDSAMFGQSEFNVIKFL